MTDPAKKLTREDLEAAMQRLMDAPQYAGVCQHIVSRYRGYRLALTAVTGDVVTRCAACFQVILITKREQ